MRLKLKNKVAFLSEVSYNMCYFQIAPADSPTSFPLPPLRFV